MAYTDDAVKAKLSALNETQEAIVTVAQWIMFHKRQAERTAQLWDQRLRESAPPKRLNLIYLANEVVQQSKARRKIEFVTAFQPIIADSAAAAFKGASLDIQQKIRRVVDVWRQRQIFDPACQQDIENRINELDRARGGPRKGALGGSLFASSASSAPPEYQALITTHSSLTKSEALSKPAASGAQTEWDKFNDPNVVTPSPPVQAARLGALLKTLANAEGAVAETLKARKTLVEGLEKLLAKNRADLGVEESQLRDINSRKVETEGKKREVEAGILRGLAQFSSSTTTGEGRATTPDHDPPRPDAEPLTPPPLGGTDVESITPIGTPRGFVSTTDANAIAEEPHNPNAELAAPVFEALPTGSVVLNGPSVLPGLSSREMSPLGGDVKRRKMSSVVVGREVGDEFAGFADEAGVAIDAEVEAMLG